MGAVPLSGAGEAFAHFMYRVLYPPVPNCVGVTPYLQREIPYNRTNAVAYDATSRHYPV